ncbi:MAG TPA: hypothetical protein VNN77_09350 [candidate division Zixibacteria bacterium]|nr:hypothetical protein [candidate division Zixibacteria bacterium]
MNIAGNKAGISIGLGLALVVFGVVLSRTTLETTGFCGPPITSRLFLTLIFGTRVSCVGLGLYLLVIRPRLRGSRVGLMLCSGAFTIALITVMLQLFYKPVPLRAGWRSSAPAAEKNQLGFRGQKIEYSDEDFVVVLLGDSQVEARASAYGWMPERRLEFYFNSAGLKARVFTLGTGGYGTDQELLALKEYYQKYRADLVVLWETPNNDVWNNVFPTYYPVNGTPKPTFWLEDGELAGPSEQLGEDLNPQIKVVALLRRYCPADRDGVWEKRLPKAFVPKERYDGPVNWNWQRMHDAGMMRNHQLSTEKSPLAMMLTPRSERTQYGLDLTRSLLKEMERLVVSRGGKFVILYTRAPESKYWHSTGDESSAEQVHVLNGKYYTTSRQQYEANVDYINRDFDVHVIPVTVEEWEVGPADSHLNEHANDQVMRDLARRLIPVARALTKREKVQNPTSGLSLRGERAR